MSTTTPSATYDAVPVRTVIIIPAYNEAVAIGLTIESYQNAFPGARLVVVDNNSKDDTSAVAKRHLRPERDLLLCEPRQGKGYAVKRGFSRLEGDIFVMTDGDMTYPASDMRRLYDRMLVTRSDMVVGDRQAGGTYQSQNTRFGHSIGNSLLTSVISRLAGQHFSDVLSGARIMSAPLVEHLDVRSEGFQLETEINIVAAHLRADVLEIPIPYNARIKGSESKLSTFRDGWRILKFAILNWIAFLPLQFFVWLGIVGWLCAAVLGYRVVFGFLETGSPYSTTAIAGGTLGIVGTFAIFTGLNLKIQGRNARRQEIARFQQSKRSWNEILDTKVRLGGPATFRRGTAAENGTKPGVPDDEVQLWDLRLAAKQEDFE
jgi:glycosyltransferase involved in cell wall biosynthesis